MIGSTAVLASGPYHIHWDWSVFGSQLFGFAVIIFIFVKWLYPPLRRVMAKSQDLVRRQLEESEHASARLAEAKQKYEAVVAEAQVELEEMRKDAHTDAEFIIEKMREAAEAEVERVRKQGRDQILQLRRQLIRDLQVDLTNSILDRTEERIRVHVRTPQAQADSIEHFLEGLEVMANGSPQRQAQARWN
jgi:F-type H+-transporting ATPase subunit delta